jgi:hypothetical protein
VLSFGHVGPVILAIRTITIASWLTLLYLAMPFAFDLPDDTDRMLLAVAAVGTVKYLLDRAQKPAHEIYLLGKEAGRAQLLAEQRAADGVVQIADRRRLRKIEAQGLAPGGSA